MMKAPVINSGVGMATERVSETVLLPLSHVVVSEYWASDIFTYMATEKRKIVKD